MLFDILFCAMSTKFGDFADINTMDTSCANNRQKGSIECAVAQLFY